jgi:hypothetical protein
MGTRRVSSVLPWIEHTGNEAYASKRRQLVEIRGEDTSSFFDRGLVRREVGRGEGSDSLLEEGSKVLVDTDKVEAVVDACVTIVKIVSDQQGRAVDVQR